ncbi:MAG TPA: DUF1275 family protein [Actinomycetota bacterium]|jgi:uncharacterized membrane protein YoaK (UPF0700 family)|nr:DUF1275 family protein [Actinomycetota bacterium]HNE88035.1 DUF1275 family protein [Actinomycetota bacterium]HNL51653.1 DUF1275 family protein [Actinomycetota bacterium]
MSSGTSTDTWHFFARPWLAALALAWTVGVIDSYSFAEYGVFTSNQAGNLVVLGNELPQDPQRATLAGLSLLGAVAGVAAATVLQRLFAKGPWLKVAVPLVFMVMLMVVGWFLRHVVGSPPETLVPVTSAALAGLATAAYRTPAIQGWITANTGAVLTTVHTAFETREERRASVKPVQPAIMITVGFLSGALLWGSGVFGTTDPTPVALIPTIIALVLAVVNARRSGDRTRSGRSSLGA